MVTLKELRANWDVEEEITLTNNSSLGNVSAEPALRKVKTEE
jgi:hypothetical protein